MSKHILITGASTGFGRGMAEQLALRGDHVFATMRDVNGRNAANREELETFAKAKSLALRVLELDVTDQASVDTAVAAALADGGRLDVVINNAGVAAIGVSEAYSPEQFEQLYAVNLRSPPVSVRQGSARGLRRVGGVRRARRRSLPARICSSNTRPSPARSCVRQPS